MSVKFSTQYDKRGFLSSKLAARWNRIAGDKNKRATDEERLARIEAMEPEMASKPDSYFAEQTAAWRIDLQSETVELDDLIEPAFAAVREASRRTTGLFHYPEQLLGGLALVRGGVAEMATGEGKTLAITLPSYAFALAGRGVHVATVNTYLAERDHEFVEPILTLMGLTSAMLPEKDEADKKGPAYQCDITYGVGYEFGFDYLRDQLELMKTPKAGPRERLRDAMLMTRSAVAKTVQRERAYAIIDEVDSVLIDEAGSPLLISNSQAGEESSAPYEIARDLLGHLEEDRHYLLDTTAQTVKLTRLGADYIHDEVDVPWSDLHRPWQNYVLNAMRAEHFFERDVQYVVDEDDAVVIVDEFTGRRHSERSWRDGLHQAVEAKEHVEIRGENVDAASITRQRYFARYERMCGLTGTGAEAAGEFWHFFKMPVQQIKLHKPNQRNILPERCFQTHESQVAAVVADIIERHKTRQPILVGTRTIKVSESISERLTELGVPHRLLTAKQDSEENEIVGQAGAPGQITIATNMAGRGTHISIGPQSLAAGGLHVIAVERNESVRIDRQLIGRAARQGEVGSAQFFVSAEDYLPLTYGTELIEKIQKSAVHPDTGETKTNFSKAFDALQADAERTRYAQRLGMAQRDEWMDDTKTSLS